MVYLAGDNQLDPAGTKDLKKLKSAMVESGGSDRVRVLAQYDKRLQPTRRFEITAQGAPENFLNDTVEEIAEVNTGDPKALIDFLRWAIKRSPARHYLLSLWGHGYGVDDETVFDESVVPVTHRLVRPPLFAEAVNSQLNSLRDSFNTKALQDHLGSNPLLEQLESGDVIRELVKMTAIGTDETSKDFLSNVELKKALEFVRTDNDIGLKQNLDIVMMDACNMGMLEVAYQIRNSTDIMLASEDVTPIRGWPYKEILSAVLADPGTSPAALSKLMVTEYIDYYQNQNKDVTQAASNLTLCEQLKTEVDLLAEELLSNMYSAGFLDDLSYAHYNVQKYYVDQTFVDLFDFCHLLSKRTKVKAVIDRCQDVNSVIDDFIIQSGFKGDSLKFSHGISVYFPARSMLKLYGTLDFVKNTRWGSFLKSYIQKTERTNCLKLNEE
jgi:hypothetical protein